ncbi:MAG: endolytic transglycosylase MltG [Coriobacteriia bacterium]|nr:endolytic transglycosylase MltG [Coriobacteriia bacterium]
MTARHMRNEPDNVARPKKAANRSRSSRLKALNTRVVSVMTEGASENRGTYTRSDMRKQTSQPLLVRAITVLVLVSVLVGASYLVIPKLQGLFKPSEFVVGREVDVYIPQGSSTKQIAKILKDNGVIRDANEFVEVCRSLGVTDVLKPGHYTFTSGMPLEDLAQELVAGPPDNSYRLTIPEGLTAEQTAWRVEAACNIPAHEFLAEVHNASKYASDFQFLEDCYDNSLEGYLYPKTYRIPIGADAEYVVRVLLYQYANETAGIDWAYARSLGYSPHDVLVIASLIERETYIPEERSLVASVIYNRLGQGMNLQIDATIIYALADQERDYAQKPLLYSDLEVESPYNTYKYSGIPPGPICSPRLESIQAAASPAQTGYYFYVLTSLDGHHTFSCTEEEHEQAVAEYIRVFGLE